MHGEDMADALGAFYTVHRQSLFTYALSITRSASCAEDAVHEAFSRVLAARRLPDAIAPYVFRCVRNAALDVLRCAVREQHKLDGYAILFQEGPPAPEQEKVAEFLSLLSDKEREIVVLKVYSGLTFREIAGVCGSRQGTVAASYWRSLRKLRAYLEPNARADLPVEEGLS